MRLSIAATVAILQLLQDFEFGQRKLFDLGQKVKMQLVSVKLGFKGERIKGNIRHVTKVNCITFYEIKAVNIAQHLKQNKNHNPTNPQNPKATTQKTLLEDLQAACKYPLIASQWEMIAKII